MLIKFFILCGLLLNSQADDIKKGDRFNKYNNSYKALLHYKKACNEGISLGCDKYSTLSGEKIIPKLYKEHRLIKQGNRFYYNNNYEKAKKYYKRACGAGIKMGCEKHTNLVTEMANNEFSTIHSFEEPVNFTAFVCKEVTIHNRKNNTFNRIKSIITVEEFNQRTSARVTVYDDKSLNSGKVIENLKFYKDITSGYGERMFSYISKNEALIIIDNYKEIVVRPPDKFKISFSSESCNRVK